MNQVSEAVTRYHKILEGDHYKNLSWAHDLQERMKAHNLVAGGKPVSPVLRPHFITRRQYAGLVKAVESFSSSLQRVQAKALNSPALMARMELLPAEKMLAAIDPGYQVPEVAARLDSHLTNGTLHVVQYNADSPTGSAYTEVLADLFYDSPPVKEFRKRYHLSRVAARRTCWERC